MSEPQTPINDPALEAAFAAFTSTMASLQSTVDRIAEQTTDLAKTVSHVDTRSSTAREEMTHEFNRGLERNHACIRSLGDGLRSEISALADKVATKEEVAVVADDVEEVADEVGKLTIRVSDAEMQNAVLRAKGTGIFAAVSALMVAIGAIFTDSFKAVWNTLIGS